MKREAKQGVGLQNPNERMGNCLLRRFRWPKDTREEHWKPRNETPEQKMFRQILKRRKKESNKESKEVSVSYHQENHEDKAKEPSYALIMHMPQRRLSTNSTAYYENVGPKRKKTEQLPHRRETEYAVLRVPYSSQPSYNSQDEDYELIVPVTHIHYPSHLNLNM